MLAPLLHHPVIGPFAAAVLGAILGSFIAALASRWPQDRSVMTGRSQCDACGVVLRPWQLVPVFSHLALRGRCASCRAPIGPDSLIIELIAAAIGAIALALHPGWTGVAIATFGWLLLPLAWLDLKHFWLPHALTATLVAGGMMTGLTGLGPDWTSRLIGAGAGFGLLGVIAFAYRQCRGREGLGGGDPLLLGAIGLWLGWQMLPLVLMIASGTGLAIALVLQQNGTKLSGATRFPLGTLMAAAAWPVALFYPFA
ncbi:prepilin peptidase [Blastomonas aquatica]|uniref:Prepilin leader peptidase/N-methyltransferase n=1 Tax=Blastomonas aquatica TaxID=1510276 RepID=A0ABQ1JGQ1_9SPHN|nr:A24 family peptidase [Blastomonas aquatica]GGB67978.1 type 4 prepilin-like proteins leader peptide-processing enzyme [Blastomonas aquatica]